MMLMREPEQLWGLERIPLMQGDSEASGSNPHPKYCVLWTIHPLLNCIFPFHIAFGHPASTSESLKMDRNIDMGERHRMVSQGVLSAEGAVF